jgi:hypothetical protein
VEEVEVEVKKGRRMKDEPDLRWLSSNGGIDFVWGSLTESEFMEYKMVFP